MRTAGAPEHPQPPADLPRSRLCAGCSSRLRLPDERRSLGLTTPPGRTSTNATSTSGSSSGGDSAETPPSAASSSPVSWPDAASAVTAAANAVEPFHLTLAAAHTPHHEAHVLHCETVGACDVMWHWARVPWAGAGAEPAGAASLQDPWLQVYAELSQRCLHSAAGGVCPWPRSPLPLLPLHPASTPPLREPVCIPTRLLSTVLAAAAATLGRGATRYPAAGLPDAHRGGRVGLGTAGEAGGGPLGACVGSLGWGRSGVSLGQLGHTRSTAQTCFKAA